MTRPLLLLTCAAAVVGCSTDLDVNAPYEENTVVYSLLNMRDSIHYVKINKAFLGEGSAFDFAQIQDSNEYRNEDITRAMVFRKTNGQRVDSFPLRDTLVAGREPGVFYGPVQKMYYFRENNVYNLPQSTIPVHLEQNSTYEMELDVRGTRISAFAPIVNDFSIFATTQALTTPVSMMSTIAGYGSYPVRWTSNKDGKRYSVQYRFNYTEMRGTEATEKSITQLVGSRVATNSNGQEPMILNIEGEQFYSSIASAIQNDPTVTKRIFTGIDLLFSVANDEFHTFLSLSEPVSGIVEDRPSYSNIEGGYGVFGSRFTKAVTGKILNDASLNELINGQYTGPLRFCSSFNVGPPYGCD